MKVLKENHSWLVVWNVVLTIALIVVIVIGDAAWNSFERWIEEDLAETFIQLEEALNQHRDVISQHAEAINHLGEVINQHADAGDRIQEWFEDDYENSVKAICYASMEEYIDITGQQSEALNSLQEWVDGNFDRIFDNFDIAQENIDRIFDNFDIVDARTEKQMTAWNSLYDWFEDDYVDSVKTIVDARMAEYIEEIIKQALLQR